MTDIAIRYDKSARIGAVGPSVWAKLGPEDWFTDYKIVVANAREYDRQFVVDLGLGVDDFERATTEEIVATIPVFDTQKAELVPESIPTVQASNDPLVQSFPELLSIDDAQLNLDLAEKYIELGVYDSARQLLNDTQNYTSTQLEQSENLLRRIAS